MAFYFGKGRPTLSETSVKAAEKEQNRKVKADLQNEGFVFDVLKKYTGEPIETQTKCSVFLHRELTRDLKYTVYIPFGVETDLRLIKINQKYFYLKTDGKHVSPVYDRYKEIDSSLSPH
jgi:hypothetical protein